LVNIDKKVVGVFVQCPPVATLNLHFLKSIVKWLENLDEFGALWPII
jgi:hypothetical protein